MVSIMIILFSTKCCLFVYMYIDLLKLKTYKLFEKSDADLSWLFFLKKPTCYPILLSADCWSKGNNTRLFGEALTNGSKSTWNNSSASTKTLNFVCLFLALDFTPF